MRKLYTLPAIIGLFLVLTTGAAAAVLVYDGFTDASNPLGNSGGGIGWDETGWAKSAASGGTIDGVSISVTATGNLAAPSDYVYLDGSVSETDPDGTFISDVFESEAPDGQYASARHLDPVGLLDLATDNTFYFSFLFSVERNEDGTSSGGEGGVLEVDFMAEDTFGRRPFEFRTSNAELSLGFGNSNGTANTTIPFTIAESYLLVGKVQSFADSSTPDVVSASIWMNGTEIGAEPTEWQMSGELLSNDSDRLIDRVGFKGSGGLNQIDELIIGETFADVTGVGSSGPDYGGFNEYLPMIDGYVDTGDWIGWVYLLDYPWVFSTSLDAWIFSAEGNWFYIAK